MKFFSGKLRPLFEKLNPFTETSYSVKIARTAAGYLLRKKSSFFAPKISDFICMLYPSVFQTAPCCVCNQTRFTIAYTGSKLLEDRLYAGSHAFPLYARRLFPLIYQECLQCGMARINPTVTREWVDHQMGDAPEAGQANWMEEESYVADKQRSITSHYNNAELDRFRSGQGRVIDISCGSGVGLEVLRDKFGWQTLKGIECDPQAVQFAREHRKLDVTKGLIYDVRLPDNYFDLAIMDNALEHHWDPQHVLLGLKRSLTPKGGIFIIVPNYHGYAVELFGIDYWNMNWGHWHYFTVSALKKLLEKTGFKVIRAYSSVCESIVFEKLNGKRPVDIDVDMREDDLQQLSINPNKKIFRGDFIHVVAVVR